jgi:methyl-accepting chemotaxis protein
LAVLDEISADERQMGDLLHGNGSPAETLHALAVICSHVDHISQKIDVISQKTHSGPVAQTGFASGEVELF